ncbi:MAG: hypothetical protein V9G20_25905 [Candidatus Promineifilaceae bacterium]
MRQYFWLLMVVVVINGCGSRPQTTPTSAVPSTSAVVGSPLPRPTLAEIPTLLPTYTPLTAATPTATRPQEPTPIPSATIEFTQLVLGLEYAIPGLGLTRTLTATFASQIFLTDTVTGVRVIQPQQSRILLELQSVLDGLVLEPVPDGCDLCPRLAYNLPVAGQSGEGWLTDATLLASLENYFSIHLGPHWPPNTVLALRRTASIYRSAQTIAFTADGQLWQWSAIDSQIAPPEPAPFDVEAELTDLAQLSLADSYTQDCANIPRETLFFIEEGESQTVLFRCPELTLPLPLTPLYTTLASLLDSMPLATGEVYRQPLFPYTTWLYYQRADGYRLTLDLNNQALVAFAGEIQATANLTASWPISLTTVALAQDVFTPGTPELLRTMVTTDTASLPDNFLMVRALEGTYEATWDEEIPEMLADLVAELDVLITELVGLVPEDEESGGE